ncbi:antibiotic biosynthesis monooxygenase family protein [Falsirhodobacter xinxiangensis]|uniref:antibiotic biosynthesis monooxygenase family protein n=1 Tax=Falsirhodobacter xinxiangensis TaxID=2530049 RepID=UPI0010AAAC13|nr:antibiotic biosynthesis monooxygenase [Rhodobacter xinxiangensis]
MIREVAKISIRPGSESQFEGAFAKAVPLFERAKGCMSLRLERSVEELLQYYVVADWETLEDHVVGFRGSADYAVWRDLVGGYFSSPPVVDHTEVVINGFQERVGA